MTAGTKNAAFYYGKMRANFQALAHIPNDESVSTTSFFINRTRWPVTVVQRSGIKYTVGKTNVGVD